MAKKDVRPPAKARATVTEMAKYGFKFVGKNGGDHLLFQHPHVPGIITQPGTPRSPSGGPMYVRSAIRAHMRRHNLSTDLEFWREY